ncbi:helix-turn-helix transcriptional regulator [Rhodococcus erythropolis]|uniref:helix-turn-helix transcriptional regulator n=1 Tax=Rhodococcus erythropolis TaxID=1833 RepID=UPI0024B70A7A|nr:helix-turn-helix transcriptional regulator [Rhodococcus erythropolis]MDJ0015033.1 helix-turn-helix transcriptional regulator [Rhodococcus erythropolis]
MDWTSSTQNSNVAKMEALDSAESRFGNRVRFEREQRGWSQSELAQRVSDGGISMHPSTITKIEARDAEKPRSIRLDEAYALAQVFGTSLETMLGAERAYDAAEVVAAVQSECRFFSNELTRMMANMMTTLREFDLEAPKDPSKCSRIELEELLLHLIFIVDLTAQVTDAKETLRVMSRTTAISDRELSERVQNNLEWAMEKLARDSAET